MRYAGKGVIVGVYSIIVMLIMGYIWPFTTVERRFHRGYGDFNSVGGFHKGIDIYSPSPRSLIQTPFNLPEIKESIKDTETGQWSILLVQYPWSPIGLLYEHVIEPEQTTPGWHVETAIAQCYNSDPDPSAVRHVHIANFAPDDWSIPLLPKGYSDVSPNFYVPEHSVVFAPITQSSYPERRISFFICDPPFLHEPFYPRKAVDFRVAPRSSISGSTADCSTGVRSLVLNSIDRMNPISAEYEANDYYQPRIIFNWSNELEANPKVSEPPPEFLSLYDGGFIAGQTFDNSYVCTNTSTIEDVGDYGIGNIWTEPYSAQQDYEDYDPDDPIFEQIRCRGAWDTILSIDRNDEEPENLWAIENSESCFPDGRYRIGLTAESHTGEILSEYLPEDRVIIDNFIPHVDRVIALHLYSDNIINIIYTGRWETLETPASGAWRELGKTVEGYLLPNEFGKSTLDALGIEHHACS